MPIATSIANLALSVITGAVKLGKRLDDIGAEEVALTSTLSLKLPDVQLDKDVFDLKAALEALLKSTQGAVPDPLGAGRKAIGAAIANVNAAGAYDVLLGFCTTYGALDNAAATVFSPDDEFEKALRKRSAAWDLSDDDVRQYTFYLAAGSSRRRSSVGFQIGAAVLDVITEVAAANTGLVVHHEPTRKLVESILTRFSEPDLASMSGWGEVLKHAMRTALNVAIDERKSLAGNRVWLERTLDAVATAREQAPNGDDFVLGLLRGDGINQMLGNLLQVGADYLSEGEEDVWKGVIADVLVAAAKQAKDAPDFESFFHDNWHALVAAGLNSLGEHGTRLLGDKELLKTTLVAMVKSLGDAFRDGLPTGATLTAVAEAGIAVVSDSDVLAASVRQKWLRELITSVADVVQDTGLRGAFSKPALERYARGALEVLSRNPEVIATDSKLVNTILTDVLSKMTELETFAIGPLADIAVGSTLDAIAANPDLLGMGFPALVGDLAHELADRVANGGVRSVHANEILAIAVKAVADNALVYLEGQQGLVGMVVTTIVDLAASDAGKSLLSGNRIQEMIGGLLKQFAATGLGSFTSLKQLQKSLEDLLQGALPAIEKLIGKQLAQQDVPEVLITLIAQVAAGKKLPAVDSPEFGELIVAIAGAVATHV